MDVIKLQYYLTFLTTYLMADASDAEIGITIPEFGMPDVTDLECFGGHGTHGTAWGTGIIGTVSIIRTKYQ